MDNFQAAKWLNNAHLQTLYSTLFRRCPITHFSIQVFPLADGDFVECYWYRKPDKDSSKPIVTLFHGLAGSYKSPYIQGIMRLLHSAGYAVVLMHFRGCSGTPNKLARAYHSGDTADAKAWIDYLHQEHPSCHLFAVGYSLGGNMLLKLLGDEYQKDSPLQAAVSVSAPLNLAICAKTMQIGFAQVYQHYLLKPLKKALLDKYQKHDFQHLISMGKQKVANIATIEEFDDLYTARFHGFSGSDDYYNKASSDQFLAYINTPTLIIHALDDPFMTPEILPETQHLPKNITLMTTTRGGHLGFISGSIVKPEYWLERRILQYFEGFSESQKD